MLTLSSLLRYARATEARIDFAGPSCRVSYSRIDGELVAMCSPVTDDGYVIVADSSVRSDHFVKFALYGSGEVWFRCRENWASGACQSSYRVGERFRLYVERVLGLNS